VLLSERDEVQDSPPPRRRRRGTRLLSGALIVAGILLLLDALLTVTWQEPVSALYARIQQERLDARLPARPVLAPAERKVVARLRPERRLPFSARAMDARTTKGEPLGRLRMPSVGVSTVFVEGTDTASLRSGPGHYPGTPLPGAHGTVAIAGHRTTYGAPFRKVDGLRPGDRIDVEMPYGRFAYEVQRTRIVEPTALWVTRRVRYDQLVLTACHPLYSAAQRIVVFARLVAERPR
jgi:sortase A